MLATYDPQLIVLTWGATLFTGYADGEIITAEFSEDAFTEKVGTQGDTVHVRNANQNGTLVVRLQQSSPINDVLSAFAAADRLPGANVIAPIQMKDLNGTTIVAAVAARIRKVPTVNFSNDSENREWGFLCYRMRVLAGGANVVSP